MQILPVTIGPVFGQVEGIDVLSGEPAEQEPGAAISIETPPAEDAAIAQRLLEILDNLDGLDQVTVAVSAGVVEIGGDVGSKDARDQALGLARRIEGVVEVVDSTTLDRDVERRLAPTIGRITGSTRDLIGYLPLLAIATLIVGAFWLLSRLSGGLSSFYHHLTPNAFIAKLLRQVVQGTILVIGVILALSVLDASGLVSTVLGAAGLLGLALSFALRDTVENYIASILLSLRQPFEPNDEVMIEGHEGRVIRLTSRATVLLTLEGNHIRIPNAIVFKGMIVNYTRKPERRFDFKVGVDTEADLLAAQELAVATLSQADGVLDDPPPASRVDELGDSSVVLWVGGWVDQRRHDHRKVKSEALRLVKEAFDDADIEMPEPIYRLRFEGGGAIKLPEGDALSKAKSDRPRRAVRATVDIARDADIDESIAEERADPTTDDDLLDPKAPRE
jgi:small-conductance mechanosensitive channel